MRKGSIRQSIPPSIPPPPPPSPLPPVQAIASKGQVRGRGKKLLPLLLLPTAMPLRFLLFLSFLPSVFLRQKVRTYCIKIQTKPKGRDRNEGNPNKQTQGVGQVFLLVDLNNGRSNKNSPRRFTF